MTALVTGSNGFVGARVVERLLARGADVRAFVRPGSDLSRLEALRDPKRPFEIFRGSLASPDQAAEALAGVRVVYHLAAALRGTAADMCLGTVVTSKNLLAAVARMKEPPRIVLVSSFSVYGVAKLPRGALVDESTPVEDDPRARDLYAQTKLRQEQLFWDAARAHDLELVVLRPGVIYGPTSGAFSARVGLMMPGVFLHLGRDNLLPLTYVDNCAEAIVLAGERAEAVGQIYNVVDDDLPTARGYLARYKREVGPLRSLSVPYPLLVIGSHLVERYHHHSQGQLPAIFTPYKTASNWKGNQFDNAKLKGLGWRPLVSTDEGIERTFEHLRGRSRAA